MDWNRSKRPGSNNTNALRRHAMAWKPTSWIERLPDVLRLIVKAALIIDLIVVSLFSIWVVVRGCQQIVEILNRWVFVLD